MKKDDESVVNFIAGLMWCVAIATVIYLVVWGVTTYWNFPWLPTLAVGYLSGWIALLIFPSPTK